MKLPDIGDLFEDRYRVESALGEGGFATVFRASDTRGARTVALKVLKPSEDGGYDLVQARRFEREARAVGALQDRYTMTLYDVGMSSSGLLYMVCEYVEGDDLSSLMRYRRFSEDEVVAMLLQALSSLREAHGNGLLHRDIKPANIRIEAGTGDVRILDFGIAKSLGHSQKLTATGRVLGTPRYMSPEQMIGDTLSPATDLYSLGVTAVELLIGRTTPGLNRGIAEGPVSAGLRAVLNRMVEPDVAKRYSTADAVMSDLRALAEQSTRAHDTTANELIRPAFRADHVPMCAPETLNEAPAKSTLSWAALFGCVVVVCLGIAAVFVMRRGDDPPPVRSDDNVVAQDVEVRAASDPCSEPPNEEAITELSFGEGRARRDVSFFYPGGVATGQQVPLVVYSGDASRDWEDGVHPRTLRELAAQHKFALLPIGDGVYATWLDETIDAVAKQACLDTERLALIFVGGPGLENLERSADFAANVLGGLCPRIAAFATVNSPVDIRGCPDAPMMHIAPLHDFSFPARPLPTLGPVITNASGKLLDNGSRRKRSARRSSLERCGRGHPSLDEFVDAWRERRGCSQRSATLSGDCTLWQCNQALAVCEVSGGSRWTDIPASVRVCQTKPPQDQPVEQWIFEFFALGWSSSGFDGVDYEP